MTLKISEIAITKAAPFTGLEEIEINDSLTTKKIQIVSLQTVDFKVTSVGTPGNDVNYPTEKAVRDALNLKEDSLGFTPENIANKGAISGYAGLDASQELLLTNFPSGVALQILRRNAANTALEFFTISSTDLSDSANLARDSNNLSFFSATTSLQLLNLIDDETGSGLLVFGTSPTIVTPTIASFVNANHNHQNAAGGGQLDSTLALSDTADIAYLNTSNVYVAGNRQDFLGLLAGTAGINVGGIVGNPTTQVDADIWLNTSTNQMFGRINGADVDLGVQGGEIFTWTNDHSMDTFKLTAATGNDVILNAPTSQGVSIEVNGIPQYLFNVVGADFGNNIQTSVRRIEFDNNDSSTDSTTSFISGFVNGMEINVPSGMFTRFLIDDVLSMVILSNGNLRLVGHDLDLDGGLLEFDDANTTIQQTSLNLEYDVATGGVHDIRVNDASVAILSATELNLQNNKLANVNPTTITDFTTVIAASGDFIWIIDATDGLSKKVDANDFLGGGASLPVVDTTSIVEGSVDPTKEMRIEVDGLTTATVRVMTMPDADVTLVNTSDGLIRNANLLSGVFAAITGLGVQSQNLDIGNNDILLGTGQLTVTGGILGDLLKHDATGFSRFPLGTNPGQFLRVDAAGTDLEYADDIASITFIIDGGGSVLTTGVHGDLEIPFNCTIERVTLLADQTGSVEIDLFVDTFANYPPVVGDSIVAAAPPTITTDDNSQDATLTGWTTALASGSTIRYNVNSVTTIQRVTIALLVRKTG